MRTKYNRLMTIFMFLLMAAAMSCAIRSMPGYEKNPTLAAGGGHAQGAGPAWRGQSISGQMGRAAYFHRGRSRPFFRGRLCPGPGPFVGDGLVPRIGHRQALRDFRQHRHSGRIRGGNADFHAGYGQAPAGHGHELHRPGRRGAAGQDQPRGAGPDAGLLRRHQRLPPTEQKPPAD